MNILLMLNFIRKISFFSIASLLLNLNAISQKVEKKKRNKSFSSQIAQSIPVGISEPYTPKLLPSKVIIDYFINEKKATTNYFAFINKNKTERFRSDSLITQFKEFIDSFIIRYNKNQYDYDTDLKFGIFKNINEKLEILKQKRNNNLNKNELKNIFESIDTLPNSEDKIRLLLKYGYVSIQIKTFFNEVISICKLAETSAGLITDLYQRAIAYIDIGDFAYYFQLNDIAIRYYYLARENLDNSDEDSEDKNYEQGQICASLANIFLYYTSQGYLKSYSYSRTASNYFRNARDTIKWNINNSLSNLTEAYLWTELNISNLYIGVNTQHEQSLNDLKFWYSCYQRGIQYDNETKYLQLSAIAENLMVDSTYKEALIYYLNAFFYAANGTNKQEVTSLLNNISYLYAKLGNEQPAMEIVNLDFYLQEKVQDSLQVYYCSLAKANVFKELKKYDSAILYLNKIQFLNGLEDKFFRSDDILQEIVAQKKDIFDSIGSDSSNFYEKSFLNFQGRDLQTVSNLVGAESEAIGGYLNRSRNKSSESELLLKNTLAKNIKIQDQISMAKNETDRLNVRLSRQRDSAESLRYADSSKSAKQITKEKEKTDEQVNLARKRMPIIEEQKKISTRERIVWILGSLIGLALIAGFIYFDKKTNKLKLSKEQDEKRKKEIELKQLDELARNKIHNIQNDYHALPNMLYNGEIEKAKLYTAEYGAYLATFFENWKKEKITLWDELILLKQYCNVKQALGQKVIFNEKNVCINVNPKTTHFIQSVFDTLLDNTVRRGFKDKQGDCYFYVKIERKGKLLFCDVQDKGTPPNNSDSYFRRKDSGLNILKSRVKGMFELKNIPVPIDFFIVKAAEDMGGTIIKIIMPYDEQII